MTIYIIATSLHEREDLYPHICYFYYTCLEDARAALSEMAEDVSRIIEGEEDYPEYLENIAFVEAYRGTDEDGMPLFIGWITELHQEKKE